MCKAARYIRSSHCPEALFMASFLSLVAGVVIGLVGGWFLRGTRTGSTQPAEPATTPTTTTATSVAAATTAATDPTATPATTSDEADAKPASETDPVTKTEPI